MIERKGTTIIGDSWDELDIKVPASRIGSTDDLKIQRCPECKDNGKRRDNTFDLSIIPALGKGKCHKCAAVFIVRTEESKRTVEKTYTPPVKTNLTRLSSDGLKFFTNRRISQAAILHFKIVERTDGMIAFPYFYQGETVNIKFKNPVEKRFSQSPNGKHVMFNYDNAMAALKANPDTPVIITEGEEETMCWHDAGFMASVSVDSGAPNPNDKIGKKLECFTNCFDLFELAKIIIIATDNDENGRRLAQELIRRVDSSKVRIVSFGNHKDANDYIMYEGTDRLAPLIAEAKEIRIEGIFYAADVQERLWDMYNNGLAKGTTTHMPSIDKVWKWRGTEVTLVTGYANEGKSSLFNLNLPVLKSVFDGWKYGLFVPENFPPEQFYEDVIHTFIGRTSDKDYPEHRMSSAEFKRGIEFCHEHFFLVHPEEAHTLDNLFKRFDYLVRKEGIRSIIIDPFNMVENLFRGGITYDLYVSRFMTDLKKFATNRDLAALLVAHQNKPEKKLANGNWPEPDPYNIKGGGTFMDKADNVVDVYRPYRITDHKNPIVQVSSRKIKMKKLVADTGSVDLAFNWKTNQFEDPLLNGRNPLELRAFAQAKEENYTDDLPF